MGTQKQKITIIGEGPTEYYYVQSLADDFRGISIQPDYPKHTSMKELEKKISQSIDQGFHYVFCLIDMDNKTGPELTQYQKIRAKYQKPVIREKEGIYCEVWFYETHLCTELFFHYYFKYTTQYFNDQPSLIKALNNHCFYEKTTDFFRKCKGLHSYFTKKGGTLEDAVKHAKRSMTNKAKTGNNYTYSELGEMIKMLQRLT